MMPIVVETTEGRMEIDFDKMELYVLRGDLCWPMVKVGQKDWLATCPLTGRQVHIMNFKDTCYIYSMCRNSICLGKAVK